MGGLEDRVAGEVVDVAAGSDADAADLRREGVGEVVAVQVERGDDVEVGRAREHLLEGDVGDGVLDDEAGAGLAFGDLAPGAAVDLDRAELALGEVVAPLHEGAFGILHDIALMDEGQRLALVGDGVLDGRTDEALGTRAGDRLDADADRGGLLAAETDLLKLLGEVGLDELEGLEGDLGTGFEVDAGVDVFGVLAEDDHVDLAGILHRGRHAGEPLYGAEADVEVELLTEGDVEGADAAAGRRGERALDADEVVTEGGQGRFRQPVAGRLEGLLASEDFQPLDLALARVGLGDRGVEDADGGAPDVRAGAVAFDEGDDGMVGDGEFAVGDGDAAGCGGAHGKKGHKKPISARRFQANTQAGTSGKEKDPLARVLVMTGSAGAIRPEGRKRLGRITSS